MVAMLVGPCVQPVAVPRIAADAEPFAAVAAGAVMIAEIFVSTDHLGIGTRVARVRARVTCQCECEGGSAGASHANAK